MNLPKEFKCPFCKQEVSINQEGDPVIHYQDFCICPNCGKFSTILKEKKGGFHDRKTV